MRPVAHSTPRNNASDFSFGAKSLLHSMTVVEREREEERRLRSHTSSITTEFPLMTCHAFLESAFVLKHVILVRKHTTMPKRTLSPPAFSSTASSSTTFKKTCFVGQSAECFDLF